MDKRNHITRAEWPIMQMLWDCETATASEIVDHVTGQKDVSMRTIKTLLRQLVAKGAVGYQVDENDARVYHYFAAVSKESCAGEKTEALLDIMTEQDMGGLLVHFIGGAKLSREQIEGLEALLQKKKDELES